MEVSVLMSVYQNEKVEYFETAMNSILTQTLAPDEILLVQDGPLPRELEQAVVRYEESCPSLRVHRLPENVQLGRALRTGVELCRNELIARMDTDDIAVPARLEHQRDFLEGHPEISVLGGWMEEFNDEGTYRCVKRMPETPEELLEYGKYRCPVNHMTVMFRKADVLECGNYQHFPNLEDYHLWSRMLTSGKKFYNMQEVLVKSRTNQSLYARRGGYPYFKRYLSLRKMQRRLGLLSSGEYAKSVFYTAGMTLTPNCVRALLYKKVLRRAGGN